MGNAKYKPNKLFPRIVMNSAPVRAKLHECGYQVKAVADGFDDAKYSIKTRMGKGRAHTFVYTPSARAIESNARNKSLIKAIRAFKKG